MRLLGGGGPLVFPGCTPTLAQLQNRFSPEFSSVEFIYMVPTHNKCRQQDKSGLENGQMNE